MLSQDNIVTLVLIVYSQKEHLRQLSWERGHFVGEEKLESGPVEILLNSLLGSQELCMLEELLLMHKSRVPHYKVFNWETVLNDLKRNPDWVLDSLKERLNRRKYKLKLQKYLSANKWARGARGDRGGGRSGRGG
jgi:hypothetical protein